MCVNPLKNPLSGIGLMKKSADLNPVGGLGMAKAVLKKRGARAVVAPLPGAVLG